MLPRRVANLLSLYFLVLSFVSSLNTSSHECILNKSSLVVTADLIFLNSLCKSTLLPGNPWFNPKNGPPSVVVSLAN
jgi:hypothetical protein